MLSFCATYVAIALRDKLQILHHYTIIIAQLWLTSHPRSTVVLLDTGTPVTSREIYSEDDDDGTPTTNNSKAIAVQWCQLFSSMARALGL